MTKLEHYFPPDIVTAVRNKPANTEPVRAASIAHVIVLSDYRKIRREVVS